MKAGVSIVLALLSMALFYPGVLVMDRTRAWSPTLAVALPAILLAAASIAVGVAVLRRKPVGGRYGAARLAGGGPAGPRGTRRGGLVHAGPGRV